jgi:hypothetical protein
MPWARPPKTLKMYVNNIIRKTELATASASEKDDPSSNPANVLVRLYLFIVALLLFLNYFARNCLHR